MTSAHTLSLIIDEMLNMNLDNREAAIEHLSAKNLLPKKLIGKKTKIQKKSKTPKATPPDSKLTPEAAEYLESIGITEQDLLDTTLAEIAKNGNFITTEDIKKFQKSISDTYPETSSA